MIVLNFVFKSTLIFANSNNDINIKHEHYRGNSLNVSRQNFTRISSLYALHTKRMFFHLSPYISYSLGEVIVYFTQFEKMKIDCPHL